MWLRVEDEHSWLLGWRVPNRRITLLFALAQLLVATLSLTQHVYSVAVHGKIFHCSFNETLLPPSGGIASNRLQNPRGLLLSSDLIIFDFGLFHELISVDSCIANYLDGGYLRALWCVGQVLSIISSWKHNNNVKMSALLLTCFVCLALHNPHPLLLWPQLVMQNAYCFGLMILTIATADKLLVAVLHPVDGQLNLLIAVFVTGTLANHFFCYVLWHFYWHEEAAYKKRTGRDAVPFWV